MPILTPTADLRRVLVSRTDGLGDVIVTLPIAVELRRRLPEVEIAFLVSPYTAPIVRRIAEVDRVLTISPQRPPRKVLRIYAPDVILFARPEFRLALDALMARIDVRIGTGYRWYSGLFTRWVYDHRRAGARHEAEYGLNLLGPLLDPPFPVTMPELAPSQRGEAEAVEALRRVGAGEEYVVVHPGSRGSAARYDAEGYAAVIRAILHDSAGSFVVVTAGDGEGELARGIVGMVEAPKRVAALEGLSLDALSELVRGSRGLLGSSSGPVHLAALVGTPVVGLYPGLPPVWPARWRPLGENVTTLVPHPEEPFCPECGRGHSPENCVARIAPERVIAAVRSMLAGRGAGTGDYIA